MLNNVTFKSARIVLALKVKFCLLRSSGLVCNSFSIIWKSSFSGMFVYILTTSREKRVYVLGSSFLRWVISWSNCVESFK